MDVGMATESPYFAEDTGGVHFKVWVDGFQHWAHIAEEVLAQKYGSSASDQGWVAVYRAHREEIDACVVQHVRRGVREIVIVRLGDFPPGAATR
jgi:methionine synthase II (cobalamin-independent)